LRTRCSWAGSDPLYIDYHDREWGVPVREDRRLFEFLVLEGFQAGLSWLTVLRKRENFRRALDDFDYRKIAEYGESKVKSLLEDTGLIRNRSKINALLTNAAAFMEIQSKFGSFSNYIWGFVEGRPIVNAWKSLSDIPPQTDLSVSISRDLKNRGFRFVGPTIVYAHMQATGMVNDHLVDCFSYRELLSQA